MIDPELFLFFVKNHVDRRSQRRVCSVFLDRLHKTGSFFTALRRGETLPLPESFWKGHYGYIAEVEPGWTDLRRMIFEFSYLHERGISYVIGAGAMGITSSARKVLGNKRWNMAEEGSLRKIYGSPDMGYNTVAHVSDSDRVRVEIDNMHEHGILARDYDSLMALAREF